MVTPASRGVQVCCFISSKAGTNVSIYERMKQRRKNGAEAICGILRHLFNYTPILVTLFNVGLIVYCHVFFDPTTHFSSEHEVVVDPRLELDLEALSIPPDQIHAEIVSIQDYRDLVHLALAVAMLNQVESPELMEWIYQQTNPENLPEELVDDYEAWMTMRRFKAVMAQFHFWEVVDDLPVETLRGDVGQLGALIEVHDVL